MVQIKTPQTIDDYIASFPPDIQTRLNDIRKTIKKAAPEAEEKISYGMPAFTFKGVLLYFAAHTNHIGLYPFTTAVEAFKEELSPYNTSKGSIQFPYDKPLPLKLIADIVKFRVIENLEKAEIKVNKSSKN